MSHPTFELSCGWVGVVTIISNEVSSSNFFAVISDELIPSQLIVSGLIPSEDMLVA